MKLHLALTSIRFKIALAFSLVFFSVTAFTSFFIYQNIEDNLNTAYLTNLRQEANNILDRVGVDPLEIPLTTPDQNILIWLESGLDISRLFEKPGFPGGYQTVFQRIQALEARPSAPLEYLRVDSLDLQLVSRNIGGLQSAQVNLLLAKDNREYQQQLKAIKNQMIGALLLSILLSAILAYVVSGFALRPIQRVINKARTIQAAEKMERLPATKVKDEIGQLSDTINEMIGRIEGAIQNQNRFFAMAAHELRTPLANMQSELEYHMSSGSQKASPETLVSLREEVIRLKNIVQDFLLMSQLKSDTLVLRKSVFRIDDLLYDTLERMKPSLNKTGFDVKLSINSMPDNLSIEADKEKIEGVLVNLIDNARKYGNNQTPIALTISSTDKEVILEIENSISSTDRHYKAGMGLGLQIAEQVMAKHHSEFKKENSQTKFTIHLSFHSLG